MEFSVLGRTFDGILERAEAVIALLGRSRPVNAVSERSRLLAAARDARWVEPTFRYAAAPAELAPSRSALEEVVVQAERMGEVGRLYAERAHELALEAEIVGVMGTKDAADLARRRYPEPRGTEARWCDAMASEWVASFSPERSETVPCDDASDARSLVRALQEEVGRLRLPVRVVVTEHLEASAATARDAIYVRAGVRHSPEAARRIALHEVHAHALPRAAARTEPIGLFRVGTAESGEDEEGRALRLERDSGLMDAARRRDLGLRHIAARSVRSGASWVETARMLGSFGAGAAQIVDIATRVHRGGGLAREVRYLPALRRVDGALQENPNLEQFLVRGRLSVHAARALERLAL